MTGHDGDYGRSIVLAKNVYQDQKVHLDFLEDERKQDRTKTIALSILVAGLILILFVSWLATSLKVNAAQDAAEHWLTSLYNKDTSETMALLYPAIHTAELGFILGQVQEKLERNHGEPVAMDPPSRRWKSKLIKGGEKYEVVKIVYGNKDIVDHSTTEKIGLVLVAGGNWKVAYYSIQDKNSQEESTPAGSGAQKSVFALIRYSRW